MDSTVIEMPPIIKTLADLKTVLDRSTIDYPQIINFTLTGTAIIIVVRKPDAARTLEIWSVPI